MGNCSRYSGSGCILVEDAKVLARGEKSYPVIDLTSMSPKSEGKEILSWIFTFFSFLNNELFWWVFIYIRVGGVQ